MKSPMEMTREELNNHNIVNQIVERYFPRSKKYPFGCKQDFLNIIDLIALSNGVLGIQVCGSDYQPHVRKLRTDEKANVIAWLSEPGTRLQIWSWRKKLKKRGGKIKKLVLHIADITIENGEIYFEETWKT